MQYLVCAAHLYFEEKNIFPWKKFWICVVSNMKYFSVILQLNEGGWVGLSKKSWWRVCIFFCCACSMKHYLGSYSWHFLSLKLQIRISDSLFVTIPFLFFTSSIFGQRKLLLSTPARPKITLSWMDRMCSTVFCLKVKWFVCLRDSEKVAVFPLGFCLWSVVLGEHFFGRLDKFSSNSILN